MVTEIINEIYDNGEILENLRRSMLMGMEKMMEKNKNFIEQLT